MTSDIAILSPGIADYIERHTSRPSELEQRLIDETQRLPWGRMQISATQAQFMAMFTRLLQPHCVVEIGTFTGLSALKVAQELPSEGLLIACDISDEWTSIGRRYWQEAGVADRIDLRIGPAADTLRALPADLVVDLAFIDADKTGYLEYLELLIPHMSGRSVVLVDNVLWSGQVLDEADQSADTVALREFNRAVVENDSLEVALLPIGDGLSMITLRHG